MKNKRTTHQLVLGTIMSAVIIAAYSPVIGQQAHMGGAPEPQAAADVSGEQLDQVVEAYMAVQEIQSALAEELQGVEDAEVIQNRVDQAAPVMEQAIVRTGLDAKEYEALINSISVDPALRAEFIAKVEAAMPAPLATQQPQQAEVPDFSDAQLRQAAQVYNVIIKINQTLQANLEGVVDADVVQQHVAKAESDMLQAVSDAGMDVDDYNQIMHAVQQSPDVQQRFMPFVAD